MKVCILGAGTAGLVAAIILRERYPLYPITIVKSGEIGIIGVGEGSTEQWAKFMRYVNIPLEDLFYHTHSTVKIGILFKDWNIGKDYVHTVEDPVITKFGRPDVYDELIKIDSGRFPLTPLFENIYSKNRVPLRTDLRVSNQYHFDTFKLNEYLSKICRERNILIEDSEILDADVHPITGNITKLKGKTREYEADLFIDCSGFRRVLAKKLKNNWISMTRFLPMNHAIAFPTEFEPGQDIEPYTTCTALKSGWSWKIPTQDRYGNGYVFSDNYINSDQALNEISSSINKNIEKVARDIKFEAGKLEKFWCKNVVSVGLCGSFAEPLEAQSIGFTIQQIFCLLEHLEGSVFWDKASEAFNKHMDDTFNNAISFLQLHYIVKRDDSDFWRDKPFELTDFNKETLEVFKKGYFSTIHFSQSPFCLFWQCNWYQVIHGVGLLDKAFLLNKNKKDRYTPEAYKRFKLDAEGMIKSAREMYTISHKEYIKYVLAQYGRV